MVSRGMLGADDGEDDGATYDAYYGADESEDEGVTHNGSYSADEGEDEGATYDVVSLQWNQSVGQEWTYNDNTPQLDWEQDREQDWEFPVDMRSAAFVALAIVLFIAFLCYYHREPMVRCWHRRQAARAARAMRAADDDGEMLPVSSWLGPTTQPVKVHIELDGVTYKIGASRDGMDSISRLPFVLTEACYESGYPELADLDLVDLLLGKKAELAYADGSGAQKPVDGQMTVSDVQAVKSFHVTIKQ